MKAPSTPLRTALLATALSIFASLPSFAQPCPCDCNSDRTVSVSELTTGVGISMERFEMNRCPAADADGSTSVQVNDLVAGVGAALDGCPAPPAPTPTPPQQLNAAELEAARALWRSQGFFHYRYRYDLGCFCRPPRNLVIEVFDNRMAELRDPATGEPVDTWLLDLFFTIDDLFDYLEASLESADSVQAQFDPTLGFPTAVYIDRIREAIDDELSIHVSDVEALQGAGMCRTRNDCDVDFELCYAPGEFRGCGICFPHEPECSVDADCGDDVCTEIGHNAETCACDGSVRVCKPGCKRDLDCPAGNACDVDGHCAVIRCDGDGACPAFFTCDLDGDARTGECVRRPCTDDEQCGARIGFCVDGECHPGPGRCDAPPP